MEDCSTRRAAAAPASRRGNQSTVRPGFNAYGLLLICPPVTHSPSPSQAASCCGHILLAVKLRRFISPTRDKSICRKLHQFARPNQMQFNSFPPPGDATSPPSPPHLDHRQQQHELRPRYESSECCESTGRSGDNDVAVNWNR